MDRNIPLLEATMTHILDHPEQHAQSIWVNDCGTAACFAGWALLLDGMTAQEIERRSRHCGAVSRLAAERLGLTLQEAGMMFIGNNTREQLATMVKDLVNGENIVNTLYLADGSARKAQVVHVPVHLPQ